MELRVLHYFLTIANEGNMSRAAEVLHITQPTLSRQIAQLERELGTSLFSRGRYLALTEAGARLKQRAEDILALAEATEAEFREGRDLSGTIRIGTGGFSSSRLLAVAIGEFHKDHPHVDFDLFVDNTEHVLDRLDRGLLDFGLMLGTADDERFDHLSMGVRERWGLLMRSADELATRSEIDAEALQTGPIIMTGDAPVRGVLERWAGQSLEHLDIVCRYNMVTNVVSLVDNGVARALTIEGAVENLDPARFAFRPLEPELSQGTELVWRRAAGKLGAGGAFLDYLQKALGHAAG